MKRLSRAQRERLLQSRWVAVLGTIGLEGQPVLTPVWYLYEGGQLLVRTASDAIKTENIRRDPRVTVCVQDDTPPYRSVTVYGRASVAAPRPGLGPRIARHYLGYIAGKAYERIVVDDVRGEEVTIAIAPEKFVTQDFSDETPAIGKLWLKLKKVLPPAL
jgi:PPOX class probable F420-dependent enzyme